MAIDVLKKVTQGAVKGAMAAGAAAMGAAQTPYQAALAEASQPTYTLPSQWFNGMSRMNADSGWTIDDSDSETWKRVEQLYKSGNTQGAINLMNQLSSQGKFGGYWADDGTYYGFAQGYTGGANASMQPVIGNQILTPNGLEYEHTTAWLTPDGKVLNLGEGGRLTNNGETWGTTDANPYGLTGRWYNDNQPIYGDIRDTTWTAWAQQQGWSPAETQQHMAESGAFTNPALNTPQGNQQRLAELQANPNADPAAIAATQQTLNQQQAAASSGGNTIYQEAVNQADAGGAPTGGTPSSGSYSSGGAGAYVPTQSQPLSFDEWYAQNGGGGTTTLTAPKAYDPNSDPYWQAYQEKYGNAKAPEWTGGEFDYTKNPDYMKYLSDWGNAQAPEWTGGAFDYTKNPDYMKYLEDWGNAQAPEYAGDPYKERRDAAIEAYTEKWGGSPYQALRDEYLQNAANTKWDYNPDTDPVWQAYQKQYRREGQRATEDTMGRYAAMTGGMPSTAAVSAASQAGNYYASQLSDKLPQLYQDAYNRYLDEYKKQLGLSEAYGNADITEYGRWLDSQNQNLNLANAYNLYGQQDYNQYLNDVDQFNKNRDFDYGVARDSQDLGLKMSTDEYNRYMDAVNQANYENEMAYKKYRDTVEDARVDREWAQKLLEYADSQGWKWREWNQYLTEYGDQLSQKEREWAYKVMRDQVSDEQDAKEMELSMAKLGAQYGDYSGLSGLGIDTSTANPKEVAYASDGSMYKFNSPDAQYFVQNAPNGTPGNPTTMTGGDGSIWRKDEYGGITITTKNGKTFTYSNPQIPETKTSGSGRGLGSGIPKTASDYIAQMREADIKTLKAAKGWLAMNASNLSDKEQSSIADYFMETLGVESNEYTDEDLDRAWKYSDSSDPSKKAWAQKVLHDVYGMTFDAAEQINSDAQGADYRNLAESVDRMAQNGRSRDEIYTEINAAVRDGLITKEQGEALKNNYYGMSDNVPNSNQTHSGGRPQSKGFNSVYQAADSYFSQGDRNKAIQEISDAYNAGKIHEYEIDIIMDRLGL